MMPDEGNLPPETPYSGLGLVNVGDGNLFTISSVGNLKVSTSSRPFCLNFVLHVPQLRHNLMSVKQVHRDDNCIVIF